MSLNAGTRVGPYEIVGLLGAGGMGEVYRARDTALGRGVALKILPDVFASDGDRLARFEREARTLASLNHPNIAAIYGIEVTDGTRALVMELVEGEDLSAQIARGPISLADALPIARQIADALEAAHEHGIIHRDLKPANIKVRSDGTVKVLDFGLAKAHGPTVASDAAAVLANSPTITNPARTEFGVILGTAAYMSPEQAAGKVVDERSDLWAFGVVLLEMLTGRRVFAGPDVAHVLAAVLKSEPDWTLLPTETPTAVRRLLRRCLDKDPKRRLRAIGDARLELDEASAPGEREGVLAPTLVLAQHTRRVGMIWSAALVLVALVLVALTSVATWWWLKPTPPDGAITRFEVATPPTQDSFSFALSPDGRQLVFVAAVEGVPHLWIRPLDSIGARPLLGTEGASNPFWSPEARAVGFFADGKLKKVDLAGGVPQVLADAPTGRGGAWSPDGVIAFAPDTAGG